MRPKRRMFWRIYLYSALMILVIIVAVMVMSWSLKQQPPHHGAPRYLARLLHKEFGHNLQNNEALRKQMRAIQEVYNVDAAIYRRDGTLIASGGDTPPKPLSEKEASRFSEGNPVVHRGFQYSFTIAALLNPGSPESPYLMFTMRGPHPIFKLFVPLGMILLVMAAMAFPMARTIARPLEKLTETARNLGQGNWGARSRLKRKDEVGVLAQTIDDMADQLQHRVEGEKELLANISHEIRTPLARINVALELCAEAEEADSQTLRSYLEGIHEDIRELDKLVEDVMVVTRLDLLSEGDNETGLRLRCKETSLQEIVKGSLSKFQATQDVLRLEVSIPDDPIKLNADSALLRRVLNNLLENAMKYSPKDSTINIMAQEDSSSSPHTAVVEVLDRGMGINSEDIPRLFDPFYRTDKSRERATGGTGLGLTLCRKIVTAHHGSMEAERREGGGSIFRFRIPISYPDPESETKK